VEKKKRAYSMPRRLEALVESTIFRWLSEEQLGADNGNENDDIHAGGHSDFGVHITYEDLYNTVIFLTCIWLSGQIASKFLRMPDLVGEIICGILLGPPLADFVPNPEAWVLLGELGYVYTESYTLCWRGKVDWQPDNLLLILIAYTHFF
jgi:hypothetical protein